MPRLGPFCRVRPEPLTLLKPHRDRVVSDAHPERGAQRARSPALLTMALSQSFHSAGVVPAEESGICGGCGLVTGYVCAECKTAHFCSSVCLGGLHGEHYFDCGKPWNQAVAPPADDRYKLCAINALLCGGGSFHLDQVNGEPPWALPVDLIYGLAPLHIGAPLAEVLSNMVLQDLDTDGFLRIGDVSYPGYQGYPVMCSCAL